MGERALALNARQLEVAKYDAAYRHENYAMSWKRQEPSLQALARCARGAYLDVGCGRGEMLREAEALGFAPCIGVEVVRWLRGGIRCLAWATSLPFADRSFDVVSILDVVEHLVPGDERLALREAARVARQALLVSANNDLSVCDGHELHINRRPYDEWDSIFREIWPGEHLERVHDGFSPLWLCT